MRVLISCEYSGRTRRAFAARGHDVISCDLLPAEDGAANHIVGDVFEVIAKEGPFDLMVAHPPCTYLANSGVRWLYEGRTEREKNRGQFNQQRFDQMCKAAQFFCRPLHRADPQDRLGKSDHAQSRSNCDRAEHRQERRLVRLRHAGLHALCAAVVVRRPRLQGDSFTLKNLPALQKPATALIPPKPGTPEHKAWSVIHNQSPGPNRWKERSRTFPGIAQAMAEAWG